MAAANKTENVACINLFYLVRSGYGIPVQFKKIMCAMNGRNFYTVQVLLNILKKKLKRKRGEQEGHVLVCRNFIHTCKPAYVMQLMKLKHFK